MKFLKGMAGFSAALLSTSVLATPTLLTEFEENTVLGSVSIDTISSDVEMRYQGQKSEGESDLTSTNFSLLSTLSESSGFTPLIGLNLQKLDPEEGESIDLRSIIVGGYINKNDDLKTLFAMSYTTTDVKDSLYSLGFNLFIPVQSVSNPQLKHQFQMGMGVLEQTDDIEGGTTFSVSDRAKLSIAPNVDLIGEIGFQIETDIEFSDGSTIETKPSFDLAAELYIHATKNLNFIAGISRQKSKTTSTDTSNSGDFIVETSATIISFGLQGSF